MIRTILVALDGSTRAPGVYDAAAEIAERFGATLHPLRAISVPPEFPAAAAGSRTDPLPTHLTQEASEAIARIVSSVPSRNIVSRPPIVRVGEPWRLIIEVGDDIAADLIVIGSHGYHGLDRILGTTAARVANVAHRNVLVVHEHAEGATRRDTGTPYRGSS